MSCNKTLTVGDIAQVFDGPHATPKKIEAGPYFLSISSLENGKLDLSKSAHVSDEDFKKWTRRVTPEEGDILFSYETRLGEVAMMPAGVTACLGRRMGLLRPDRTKILPEYLLYAYQSPAFQETIRSKTIHGATVDRIALKELPSFPIQVPPILEQEKIVNVLKGYDRKLILNAETNKTLEQMAQAIFKSWFVDFDPVKAKINGEQPEGMDEATASLFPEKLVESELGLIPEGWPVGKLSELIKFANGKSGTKSDSGQFPLYGANGIIGFSEEAKFEDAVIIGRVGAYCGAIEYCNSQFWASDNTIVATAKGGKAQLPFVLYLLKFLGLNQHAGGAAQPLLNQKVLNSLEVPIPSNAVLERYGELLATMLDKMTHNIEENHNLESLRDTLLPKLLSGEIELAEISKTIK
nr:restriction endonuclease subunit S [uncultured Vibrio sp.]